jgi:hypothetical protein
MPLFCIIAGDGEGELVLFEFIGEHAANTVAAVTIIAKPFFIGPFLCQEIVILVN